MTKPTRDQERELNDIEQWIATVNEYLDILAHAAENADNRALLRVIDLKMQAQLRRLASLKARRQAIQKQLGGKERNDG